jgi:hypothetical protein
VKLHPSLTPDRVLDAVKRQMFDLDNPGFCVNCGEETGGCEPDARNYPCEECDLNTVYGAEELMLELI